MFNKTLKYDLGKKNPHFQDKIVRQGHIDVDYTFCNTCKRSQNLKNNQPRNLKIQKPVVFILFLNFVGNTLTKTLTQEKS